MPSGRETSVSAQERMLKVWLQCQSTAETARKCRVSESTVRKYMRENDWRGRKKAIKQRVQKATDDSEVYKLAGELKALHVFIQSHIAKLAEQLKEKKMEVTVTNLLNLINAKRELLKEVEPEVPLAPQQDNVAGVFNQLSEDAQRRLAEAALAQLDKGHVHGQP